ncbi:hypothetical protein AB6809_29935 [Paraburkholderia sp. RCC_158]|uniref:hypothetical protein n=1 Tax=Paraburkholderia sp. RCC_158 TaxID=3239220 RepID=UPI0035269BAA
MSGDTKTAERAELDEFLTDMEVADYKTSTVAEFKTVGDAMIAAGMVDVAGKLRGLKLAMANEYGD